MEVLRGDVMWILRMCCWIARILNSITIGGVTFDSVAVPEPSTTALLGLGGLALIMRRRK